MIFKILCDIEHRIFLKEQNVYFWVLSFLDRIVILYIFIYCSVYLFIGLPKKTSDEFASPISQPDLGPFNSNAVVRKNLLQALMLFPSAPLAKEAKIDIPKE